MKTKKEEKQLLVYDAALKMFARYGYRKTTLDDIGEQLGMTKGNLYLYAKNKRDLYESSIAFALREWQQNAYAAAAEGQTVAEQILKYCVQGYRYLQENRDLHTLIINDPTIFPLSPGEDRFHEINLESMALLKEMLRTGIRKGEFRKVNIDDISELLYSVYVMMIIRTYVKSEVPITIETIERGYDLILNGLINK